MTLSKGTLKYETFLPSWWREVPTSAATKILIYGVKLPVRIKDWSSIEWFYVTPANLTYPSTVAAEFCQKHNILSRHVWKRANYVSQVPGIAHISTLIVIKKGEEYKWSS